MRGVVLALGPLTLLVAACGGQSMSEPAVPRAIPLNWHEAAGRAGGRFIVDVGNLVVRPNGWTVTATVKNDTAVTYYVGQPHHPGRTEFGLLVLPTAGASAADIDAASPGVFASTSTPPVPRVLKPGGVWNGWFSGRGRLERGRYVRVKFGRFTTIGPRRAGLPWRFDYITDHVAKL